LEARLEAGDAGGLAAGSRSDQVLQDIALTILGVLGEKQPREMTRERR